MRLWRSALGVAAGVAGFASAATAQTRPPNIVFILADDLGVNDVPLYGSTFHQMPRVDALARQGLTFTQAYSASPLCSPTRSSILTGLYPARIGITLPHCHVPEVNLEKRLVPSAGPNVRALDAQTLTRFKTDYFTLAEALKQKGYTTGHFGKWHLGREPYSPLEQGFDVDVPHTDAPSPLPKGFFYPFPVWPAHGRPGDNLEDLVCDEAVKFIGEHKDQPFFLNYWSFQPHSPWQAKPGQIDKYRARMKDGQRQNNPVYAGMLETLDECVGRIVDALDRAGVRDNTIIVFTSDNGPFFHPNNEHMPAEFWKVPVSSAYPLRAGKGTVYEGGTRVPLVVVWPGLTKPDSKTDALFGAVDFFPTFADVLDLKMPADVKFDGVSGRSILEKNAPSRDELFIHFPHQPNAQPYVDMPAPTPNAPASTLRQGDWKLVRYFCDNPDQTDRFELYDLKTDPGEADDLSSRQPERVKAMNERLSTILKETDAVVPAKNPTYRPRTTP